MLQGVVALSSCRRHKRDVTSKIVASRYYRVYISGDYSEVEGRKRQHGVGLAITGEIVKKAGKDGIAIRYISARLLKARLSIKSNFITFVVAYTLTKKAAEGQKTKYKAALNSTLASA